MQKGTAPFGTKVEISALHNECIAFNYTNRTMRFGTQLKRQTSSRAIQEARAGRALDFERLTLAFVRYPRCQKGLLWFSVNI